MSLSITWMIRRHLPEVLEIENSSFDIPLSEEKLLEKLRQTNCIAMICEINNKVVGYMMYEIHTKAIYLVRLAVHPNYRKEQVGQAMMGRLIKKLTQHRRDKLIVDVDEYDLNAQIFFRSAGLRATKIIKGESDTYRMVHQVQTKVLV